MATILAAQRSDILTGHIHFDNELFDSQLLRILGHIYDKGADIGECLSTAYRIMDGDIESWYREWHRTAARVEKDAESSQSKGQNISARDGFLRASEYHRTAEFFLRGNLDDQRITDTADSVRSCFLRAASMFDPPFQAIDIPYMEETLPGYYFRRTDLHDPRPTVVIISGYDSFCEESYFNFARAALERGYNAISFDGPGQGQCLRRQHLYFRPDWETVLSPVLDFAGELPGVDRKKLVVVGRSFAGYLAPRAVAFDERAAALVVDPGLIDLGRVFRDSLPPGTMDEIKKGNEGAVDEQFEKRFAEDPFSAFFFRSRMASHGIISVSGYIQEMLSYDLKGVAQQITCPTIITTTGGKGPLLGGQSQELYDAVEGPKKLLRFSAEEGAGDHCEAGAPALFYQKVFDALEEML